MNSKTEPSTTGRVKKKQGRENSIKKGARGGLGETDLIETLPTVLGSLGKREQGEASGPEKRGRR